MSTSPPRPRKWLVRRRLKASAGDGHDVQVPSKVKLVVARRIRPGQTLPLKNGSGSVTLIDDIDQIETVPETVAIPRMVPSDRPESASDSEESSPLDQIQIYRRHLEQIAQAKNVELEQTRDRLNNLLCGEALLATKEERIMERWQRINDVWDRTRRQLSRRIGVSIDRLSMNQGGDYREKIEALHLLNTATPLESKMTSPSSWKMTLRGETSTFVPIGNIFSGLFCEVKSTPPGMIETIRKPTRGRDNSNKQQPQQRPRPAPGWKTSSAYRQRFYELRHRIAAVRPHEILLTEALEIVGQDLFDLRRSAPDYSCDRQSSSTSSPPEIAPNPKPTASDPNMDAEPALPLIVRLELSASELVFDLTAAQSASVSRVTVSNSGTTAIHFRFRSQPRPESFGADDRSPSFTWLDADYTILPGESVPIAFRFAPVLPAMSVLPLRLEMFPAASDASPTLLLIGVKRVAWRQLDDGMQSFTSRLNIDSSRAFVESLIEELAETSIADRIKLQAEMRSYVMDLVTDCISPLCELRADLRLLLNDVMQRRVWPRCERYDEMSALVVGLVHHCVVPDGELVAELPPT